MAKEKVVLAYSGGLDTSAMIPWLIENFDYEVICCCVDCGQGNELDGLEERAMASGASKLYIEDINDDFAENYIMPCVKAGAVYENSYLLGTSMARPAIAKRLVEIARKEGATAICHGATGKGNDQIRFELGIKALAPDIRIIAPWRMTDVWNMQSREDEIAYCREKGIDLPFDHASSYSRDRNLWHISHEGLELEDPANAPDYDHMLVLGVTPEKAPDASTEITLTFEKGIPVAIASDFNPGSCPSLNLQFAINLGCLKYRMTPEEVLTAVTINPACGCGRGDLLGSLEPGKQADLVIWNAPDFEMVCYRFGSNLAQHVMKKGIMVK